MTLWHRFLSLIRPSRPKPPLRHRCERCGHEAQWHSLYPGHYLCATCWDLRMDHLTVAIALMDALSREADAARTAWESDRRNGASLSRLFMAEAAATEATFRAWQIKNGFHQAKEPE